MSIDEIKLLYPDEWVLLQVEDNASFSRPNSGNVLLHGKDYLELCYKGSEIAKNILTTTIYTGTVPKNRKWLKSIR